MNMLQALISSLFSQPRADDIVLQFVAANLQDELPCLLVTDPLMEPFYLRMRERLRAWTHDDMMQIVSDLPRLAQREVIMLHSTYDAVLVKKVALHARRLILVVEYFDNSQRYCEQIKQIEAENGCEIVMAFIEEGAGERQPYSPTESHYLGHKIRRITKESL